MTALRHASLVVFIAAHAVAAGLFRWRAPHGFALGSPHFFADELLPALVVVACAASIVHALRTSILLCLAGVWLGGAAVALALFPASTLRLVMIAAAVGVALALLACTSVREAPPARRSTGPSGAELRNGCAKRDISPPDPLSGLARARVSSRDVKRRALALAVGLLVGGGWTAAQRAPEASTHPLGGIVGAKEAGDSIAVECGRLSLDVEPLLRFESCSDERFWALWANRPCPPPGESATQVRQEGSLTVIEAQTRLEAPVFSHLNSFTTVGIRSTGLRATIAGGAALPFTDAPRHFAWLSADRIVQSSRATEDEKGPFVELSATSLAEGALVVILSDGAGPACRLTFETWAAQASAEASPTAGWGVAQNDAELLGSEDASAIVLSLAATSIGRGWDTVATLPASTGTSSGSSRCAERAQPRERFVIWRLSLVRACGGFHRRLGGQRHLSVTGRAGRSRNA